MTDADWLRLHRAMETHGCVRITQVETPSGPVEPLVALSAPFGEPVAHKLSDAHGIWPIRYIPGYPEYANANCGELELHTDGSFEQTPPAILLMYCEVPAESGGLSRVASGDHLYRYIVETAPACLPGLLRDDAFSIRRDDRTAQRPVFEPVGGRLRLAFRTGSDIELKVHEDARPGFELIKEWLAQPENFVEFTLEPGEVLILDNTRMLHGRSAFSSALGRRLHGLLCNGANSANGPPRLGIALL